MCNLNRLCKLAISQSKQNSVACIECSGVAAAVRAAAGGASLSAAPISPVTHAPGRGTHHCCNREYCATTMTVKIDEKEKSACKRKYETSFSPESKSVKESSPKLKRRKVRTLSYILFNKDSAVSLSIRFLST